MLVSIPVSRQRATASSQISAVPDRLQSKDDWRVQVRKQFPWLPEDFEAQRTPGGDNDTVEVCRRIENAFHVHELMVGAPVDLVPNMSNVRAKAYKAIAYVRHTKMGWQAEYSKSQVKWAFPR